ncbi:tRNA (adenosine(37)-N6)-dimethylallyltransferase MiaA [bacterium]|nr:MAG: tRNA (adenosine(37)-N6)-dimethylallyltransferase MiaA [bacterium]
MGPTASGKTALAVELALRFGAEIVSADSRQVYRGMAVGTAQPDAAQLRAVRHHLVGFLEPEQRYSAARFVRDAAAALDQAAARGRRAIVTGGTGFYLRALSGEMTLAGVSADELLRARLREESRIHSQATLHAWLAALDPRRATAIASGDRYRTLRALEVVLARGGTPPPALPTLVSRGTRMLKFALMLDRAELSRRIRARTQAMIERGLLDEAQALEERDAPAADAVGYPQASAYLRGLCTRAELEETLARATRRYAKRQMTWLRGEPALRWVVSGAGAFSEIERWARESLGWT